MNNYTYIVSSLPEILRERTSAEDIKADEVIGEIRSQLSPSDGEVLDLVLRGFDPDRLDREFYVRATSSAVHFVREYFTFDMNLRNAKARYLNSMFNRPEAQDTIVLDEDTESVFDEEEAIADILKGNDILAREKGLDDVCWQKVEDITTFNYFDLDAILGFVVKLKIIDRWLRLDEQAGREYFRTLVTQVRSTFKGVDYSE